MFEKKRITHAPPAESFPSGNALVEWARRLPPSTKLGVSSQETACPMKRILEALVGGAWTANVEELVVSFEDEHGKRCEERYETPALYEAIITKIDFGDGVAELPVHVVTAEQFVKLVAELVGLEQESSHD